MRLHRLGLKPRFTVHAEEVFELVARTPPIAVLVDVPAPGLSVHLLLSITAKLTGAREIPVILTSTVYGEDSAEAKSLMDQGAFAFIARPAGPRRWRSVFREAIRVVGRPWQPRASDLNVAAERAIGAERGAAAQPSPARAGQLPTVAGDESGSPLPPAGTRPPLGPGRRGGAAARGAAPSLSPPLTPRSHRVPMAHAPSAVGPAAPPPSDLAPPAVGRGPFSGLPPNALRGRLMGEFETSLAARSLVGNRLEVLAPRGTAAPTGTLRLFFAFVTVLRDANKVWNLRLLADCLQTETTRNGLLITTEIRVANPEEGLRAFGRELARVGA